MVGPLARTRRGVAAGAVGVGAGLWFDKRPWRVVGVFEAPGTVMEAEVWCPPRDLQLAAKRGDSPGGALAGAPGGGRGAVVWCPVRGLEVAAKRGNYSCVVLTLGPGAEFGDVDAFCKQ